MYRYYLTQRPAGPGCFPKPDGNRIIEVHNFDDKSPVPEIGRSAWAYIEYEAPLSDREIRSYELTPWKTPHLELAQRLDRFIKDNAVPGEYEDFQRMTKDFGYSSPVQYFADNLEDECFIQSCIEDTAAYLDMDPESAKEAAAIIDELRKL